MQTKHRLILLLLFSFFILNLSFSIVAQAASLSDNGNGTVTDSSTGLVWQQGEGGTQTWENALAYCEGLSLGGADDWRLPNVEELESLTDDARYNPALDRTYFPNANSSYYWSSTTHANYTNYAWLVNFLDGNVPYGYKYGTFYVRCVRGGQSGGGGGGGSANLEVTVIGSGNVTSNPAGIACNSGTCSSSFDQGTSVTLTAVPNSISLFGGWTGCSSGTSSCSVTMDANKAITASFGLAPKVVILRNGYSYDTLLSAYNEAQSSDTLKLLEDTLLIGTTINKALIMEGGYKADFTRTVSGFTTLQGTLTIGSGSLVVDRIVVK